MIGKGVFTRVCGGLVVKAFSENDEGRRTITSLNFSDFSDFSDFRDLV